MTEGGLEKSGYVDVKQPQKLKGRKLKVKTCYIFSTESLSGAVSAEE